MSPRPSEKPRILKLVLDRMQQYDYSSATMKKVQSRRKDIRMKALMPAEILKVLKVASQSKRNHAMILLAYRHGMRASEICNLKLSDIDMKNGEITIRRLKGSLKTVQPLADHAGQPLLSEKKVLRAWLAERRDASEFLFTSQKGGRLDRTQFFRIFQSIAEQAGLPAEKRHPHCLKHSLGFALVAGNVHLSIVKQALGHKSIASTAIYAVPTQEQVGKAVNTALANLF
jgi:type 1 fimbriae regulatory protein FimB